jgi:poly-gamma-glutamate synthesis protein (capsule biosynthesis protein)
MSLNALVHKFAVLIGAIMIMVGIGLGVLAFRQLPTLPGVEESALAAVLDTPASPLAQPASPLAEEEASPQPLPLPAGERLVIALAEDLPQALVDATSALVLEERDLVIASQDNVNVMVRFNWDASGGEAIYQHFFAAATRFDTIDLNVRQLHIERAWDGNTSRFNAVAILAESLPALAQLLGEPGDSVVTYEDMDSLVAATYADNDMLALVPFDQLQPALAVYSVDGQTPVENAVKFNAAAYPLVATVYAHLESGAPSNALSRLSAALPTTNRDPSRLTVVAMTGVTAMVRLTAAEMDERGPAWPAEVVGPELASADITAISNEVPFVPGCETNIDDENLVFCSKPEYMATLRASGADIIGLTGNHQNDYGYEDALVSLDIYEEEGLPVYGGGADKSSALQPLFIEHNGNRLAFLGANSYGPESAWATDFSPGSARFDLAIMSAAIRSIKETGDADVVLTELQYQEHYDVTPLYDQRLDFGALARAGADIVTGVQSHVPQAIEFVEGRTVLYGLGNLYFDQMLREDTREGLIVKHTIYNGRHISTQLLPTLLYDNGQPRWPDPERRAAILAKVFGASDLHPPSNLEE